MLCKDGGEKLNTAAKLLYLEFLQRSKSQLVHERISEVCRNARVFFSIHRRVESSVREPHTERVNMYLSNKKQMSPVKASTRCSCYTLKLFSDSLVSRALRVGLSYRCAASLLYAPVNYRAFSIMRVLIVRMRDKRRF